MIGVLIAQLDEDDRTFALNLYKSYYSLTRKTIYNMIHSNDDIEDLIDDVFVKLIEKISLLRTFNSPKTTSYIVYTIRSVSINYIKHKKVESKHLYFSDNMDNLDNIFDSVENLDEKLVRQEELETLSNAISKLPQNQKDLLYFKYVLDMSDSEIADILVIASNSVRQYLTRARRNAKKLMEKELSDDAK